MADGKRYRENEADAIIRRAALLDEQSSHDLPAESLRAIAIEAGISAAAVDRAMNEHSITSPAPTRRQVAQRRAVWVAATIGVGFLAVAGVAVARILNIYSSIGHR